MSMRVDATTRSDMDVACGARSRSGRSGSKRSRTGRACRATDRSSETGVVQDPGGRRERPSDSREPPERSGRTTPHLRHVPGGAFHVSRSETRCISTTRATPSASTRSKPLFDNRWSGKISSTATPWSAVGRREHGAMGRGLTRLPLLGAPAAPSRRRRTTHGAIAQRHRASGCRPEGRGFERARGAALTSRRRWRDRG